MHTEITMTTIGRFIEVIHLTECGADYAFSARAPC